MLANQTKMKKVDDRTVEFANAGPWATFPAMLAGGPGMITAPAAYKDPEAFKPIGAGPFELDAYKPGEELAPPRPARSRLLRLTVDVLACQSETHAPCQTVIIRYKRIRHPRISSWHTS